jgi:hypothetical protein
MGAKSTYDRAYQRNWMSIPMTIDAGGRTFTGNLINYTVQGGKFENSEIKIPKDGHFSFRIGFHLGREIRGSAQVVSCVEKQNVAFVYEKMSEECFTLLEGLVNQSQGTVVSSEKFARFSYDKKDRRMTPKMYWE